MVLYSMLARDKGIELIITSERQEVAYNHLNVILSERYGKKVSRLLNRRWHSLMMKN